MPFVTEKLRALLEQQRRRRARLPWAELEAEAARQGCSPADVFFDRAGRPVAGLPAIAAAPPAPDPHDASAARGTPAPNRRKPTFDTWGRRT
jgi:hypothetical protein